MKILITIFLLISTTAFSYTPKPIIEKSNKVSYRGNDGTATVDMTINDSKDSSRKRRFIILRNG